MYKLREEALAADNCASDTPVASSAPKTFHECDLDLAKKGFRDPDSLSDQDIRQLCSVMIFYSSKLANLP